MINVAFISTNEPKNSKEASLDDSWILVVQEELNQFTRNNILELHMHQIHPFGSTLNPSKLQILCPPHRCIGKKET